ncbi:MAG: TRAP transporter substrate-binding protein DctP [Spirochaetota bacterium]
MKRLIVLIFASLILLASVLPVAAQSVNLRVAAFVPSNSPWDAGLKRLAADFEKISGGTVRISFPQSLKGASESDIIQKLKLGLDGALLSTSGLAELYPDTLAISMPSVILNDAELQAVLDAVDPLIKARIGQRYTVLAVTKAGWVRLYSKAPIVSPEDLGKMRVSVPQGDELIERLFQSLGSRTVKGDWTSLFLQLSSNAVDVFYTSPIMVSGLWSQFKGKVSYISPLPIAPYIGALVFSKNSWEKVPAALRPQLEAAAKKVAADMALEGAKMENDAVTALTKEGLVMPPTTEAAALAWKKVYTDRRNGLLGEIFSAEFLTALDGALAKTRAGK